MMLGQCSGVEWFYSAQYGVSTIGIAVGTAQTLWFLHSVAIKNKYLL